MQNKGESALVFTSRTITRTFAVLFRIHFPVNWGQYPTYSFEYVLGQPRKLNLCSFVVQTAITLVANEYFVTYELLFGARGTLRNTCVPDNGKTKDSKSN